MKTDTWAIEDTVDVSYDPTGESGGGSGPADSVVFGGSGKNDSDNDLELPSLVDDHDGLTNEELDDLLDEMNDALLDEEKEDMREMIEEHCQDDDGGPDNPGAKDGKDGDGKPGGKQAGKGAGGVWTFANVDANKVKKKKKWETVIKNWVLKKLASQYRDTEQWARVKPRFAEILAQGELSIPTEMEVEDMYWDEEQIELFFFQDYSGSCVHLKDRFFKAAASLPPDKFKVHLFTFDTRVYATTLESKKVFGGGGTAFGILEDEIQKRIKSEGIKYPEAVFVVTDGYSSDHINPAIPSRWYFFLSEHYTECIPKECHVFKLSDYE